MVSSLSINDNYLVIGDNKANKVDIYEKNSQGQWRKSREIYPPKNSIPYKVGNGFGGNLKLNKNTLMIDAVTVKSTVDVSDSDCFHINESLNSVFLGKYFIRLDRELEVTTINFPLEQKEGFSQFYILYEGNPKLITLSGNGKEYFGGYIAVHNDLLLIGSPSNRTGGKGLLFNLKALEKPPIELTTDNANLGDTVAISEQFAIVGHSGYKTYDIVEYEILSPKSLHPKTLIKSLKNSSTFVLNSSGYVSLDKNILAIMRPGYYSSSLTQSPCLQVFCIDKDSTPHLILERKYSKDWMLEENVLLKAKVQNGWLITIEDISHKIAQVCLEPIEQIISK